MVALLLGLVGTILGVIALATGGGGFTEMTLNLQGANEVGVEYPAPGAGPVHPQSVVVASTSMAISGDRTGEYLHTCIPVALKDLECNGAFLLEDGVIEIESTNAVASESEVEGDGVIIGGTRAYESVSGSFQKNWETNTFTLHLLIPKQ